MRQISAPAAHRCVRGGVAAALRRIATAATAIVTASRGGTLNWTTVRPVLASFLFVYHRRCHRHRYPWHAPMHEPPVSVLGQKRRSGGAGAVVPQRATRRTEEPCGHSDGADTDTDAGPGAEGYGPALPAKRVKAAPPAAAPPPPAAVRPLLALTDRVVDRLFHGDNVTVLRREDRIRADGVITSPPFNVRFLVLFVFAERALSLSSVFGGSHIALLLFSLSLLYSWDATRTTAVVHMRPACTGRRSPTTSRARSTLTTW